MIHNLGFIINGPSFDEELSYSSGIKDFEYNAAYKKLTVRLNENYVCSNEEKLKKFNVSCTPYVHVFYDVDVIVML